MRALLRRLLGVLTAVVLVAAGCGGSGGGEMASCVPSPGNDKYCLVAYPEGGGGGLKRVRALRDITVLVDGQPVLVAAQGEIGGWVEGEDNLSAEGSAWVGGDAKVFDRARVEGDALVTDFAEVSDGAVVRDQAQVSGRAKVFGRAQVSDGAAVVDAAVVCSEARVYEQAVVEGEAVVCGSVPRAFSQSTWAGAGEGASAARMVAWVQGWSELGTQPVRQRAGLTGTGAHVFGYAAVSDQAWVFERAKVYGEAEITDQARVYEDAQVFDYSKISDQASVYGRALVFSRADSEYVSRESEGGENHFRPIFAPNDVARMWWTDSRASGEFWALPIEGIQHKLENYGVPSVEEKEGSMESGDQSNPNVDQQATRVTDRARVFGQARVWGQSAIFGHARTEGWVSGGSIVVSRVCDDFWTNRLINSSADQCMGR
ncbi:hypothetical protein [Candidatus Poriferisocius sp.]|uniref:hypothetical protein n=1 Tax=Candidatus Poriferisocius sp. TaxID=3101276 RepID=UPI003B5CD7A2